MNPEVVETVERYLSELFEILGESVHVQVVRQSDRDLALNLEGTAIFAQADAKTLRSLSYLAEIAVRRRLGMRIRIDLDVDGRRQQHIAELQAQARAWAERARGENRKIELEPMETYERKAIHEALSDVEGVRTYSVGRGGERRLIIEPTDAY